MRVRELCQRLNLTEIEGDVGGNFSREIDDIVQDSRQAGDGKIFLARRGRETDGHKYITDAYRRGSRVFVVEYLPQEFKPDAVYLRVDNPAGMLGLLAAEIYGHPEDKLAIYGITGTNGKTTTSFIIQHLLQELGVKGGLIGTIQVDTGNELFDTPRTTPEANQIFRYLNMMVEAGCQAAVMEVSSHALSLQRIEGLKFRAAIFTNISRDHLDFHADFADYLGAKLSLLDYLEEKEQGSEVGGTEENCSFEKSDSSGDYENFGNKNSSRCYGNSGDSNRFSDVKNKAVNSGAGEKSPPGGRAFYNIDDNRLRRSFQHFTGPKFSYGIEAEACYQARNISYSSGRLAFELKEGEFESSLTGRFNIYNCLASLAPLLAEGYRTEKLQEALASFPGVPGRFEQVKADIDKVSGEKKTDISEIKAYSSKIEADKSEIEADNSEIEADRSEIEADNSEIEADNSEIEADRSEINYKRQPKDNNGNIREADAEIQVFVDYAHTPAGMENVLRAVQDFHGGRIISVFGCGGDRDKEKRPEMGEIGLKMSDLIFVTSDNPRSEKPEDIIEDILAGVRKRAAREDYPESAYQVFIDREEAIFSAVTAAEPGDIVIIFGKGHETYQEFADRTIDFDDREVARRALISRRSDV